MGLHDLQVVINASSTAEKLYYVSLMQEQIARSQNAIHLNEQARIKESQAQQAEQDTKSRIVSEDDEHRRKWKKEDFRKKAHSTRVAGEETGTASLSPGNIIDIKA